MIAILQGYGIAGDSGLTRGIKQIEDLNIGYLESETWIAAFAMFHGDQCVFAKEDDISDIIIGFIIKFFQYQDP